MKHFINLKKFMRYAGIFLIVTGFTGCSDDDDLELPIGKIQVENFNELTGNILTIPGLTVGQDSWLAAVEAGNMATNNFIAQPVLVKKGTSSNVQLTIDESVVNYRKHYAEIVLKLYVENLENHTVLYIKTITIMADLTDYIPFRHLFDENGDGTLDSYEVSKTYLNFSQSVLDIDGDGYLNFEEFYRTTFLHADVNWDGGISEDEWNEGHLRMYGKWADDSFSSFDLDKNNFLNWEEWIKIFEKSEWFETYDTNSDNLITEAELNEGFFRDWDLNKDGKIDEDEFDNYRPYVIYWENLDYVYN